MTYQQAANKIREHKEIHFMKEYPHAIFITEALDMAIELLEERARNEDFRNEVYVGMEVYYVNEKELVVEKGEIIKVNFCDLKITSFLVQFQDGRTSDFHVSNFGVVFFRDKESADKCLETKM